MKPAASATPTTFRSQAAFRAWLRTNHKRATDLLARLFKVHAAHRGLTYAQALDEALCFGWIDGVRRALDEDSFSIRFTPRKPRSIWSRVNVAHARRLIEAGCMAEPGRAAFEARTEDRTGLYSFERSAMQLSPGYLRRFQARKAAWTYFQGRQPWYRRTSIYWVMSAKRNETRERRLELLISCSARRAPLPQLARTGS